MKIMHICLNGAVTDGFSYQENILSKYQKKLGHEVVLLTSLYSFNKTGKIICLSDKIKKYFNEDGIKIIRIPLKKGYTYNSKFKKYINFYSILENENPDYLFIHDFQYRDTKIICSYLKKHTNVVAVADNHADYINSATNWISKYILHKIIWRLYVKKMMPYIKVFYGVLPSRVNFMKDMYGIPSEKCELLLLGTDDELAESASNPETCLKLRNHYGIEPNDFLIVTGGKIDSYKMQTLLLMEAVYKLNISSLKLIIFGSVDDDIKVLFNNWVDGIRIQYIGWIDAIESYNYFAAANLVLFPGKHSVFWEQAVGQGKPMIVRHWEGAHHIDLGGNVIFLYEDSISEIQNSILTILEDQIKYEKMKTIAETKGRLVFSYKNIAQKSIIEED